MILMIYLHCKTRTCEAEAYEYIHNTYAACWQTISCSIPSAAIFLPHIIHTCVFNFRALDFNVNFYIRKLFNCIFGICANASEMQRSASDTISNRTKRESRKLIIDYNPFCFKSRLMLMSAWTPGVLLLFVLIFFYQWASEHMRETLVYNQYCSRSYIVSYVK